MEWGLLKSCKDGEMKDIFKFIGLSIIEGRDTFVIWGKSAWGLDRITDGNLLLKILLVFLLKVFVHFSLWLPKHSGNGILVLSMRP